VRVVGVGKVRRWRWKVAGLGMVKGRVWRGQRKDWLVRCSRAVQVVPSVEASRRQAVGAVSVRAAEDEEFHASAPTTSASSASSPSIQSTDSGIVRSPSSTMNRNATR
jgi:hypothetical protein